MATGLAEIAYRPVRIGSLIRSANRDDFLSAIRLNTALWGGGFNPIFEVHRSERRTEETLSSLPVDALHPIADRAAVRRVLARHDSLRWPRYGSLIRDGGYERRLAAVDIQAALSRLRAVRDSTEQRAQYCLPRWSNDHPFALVFAATFGDIDGAEDLIPGVTRALADATGAIDADADAVAAAARHHRFPIDATRVLLRRGRGMEFSFELWDGVFIGDANSVSDVCIYWNLRSLGVDALFWDREIGGPFADAIASDAAAAVSEDVVSEGPPSERWYPCYLPLPPMRPDQLNDAVPAELRALLEPRLQPVIRWAVPDRMGRHAWRFRTTEPEQTVIHSDDLDATRSRIVVPLDNPPFRRGEGDDFQSWVVVISSEFADRGYRGTLKLPPLTDLNGWFGWEMGVVDGGIRVEHGAVGVITSRYSVSLNLVPIAGDRIMTRVFERSGITARRNPSGETARHLISQLGGWHAIHVLRIPGVRRLLSRNDALTGLSRVQAREAIRDDGSFESAENFHVSGGRLATPDDVFDFLLSRRIFLPGLEIGCPQCLHKSYFAAGELADVVRCPKCSFEFLLAPSLKGDQWRYRLSGLLENRAHRLATQQADSQPEAIPVLLALLLLNEHSSVHGSLLLETNHDLTGGAIRGCESDFLALVHGDRDEEANPHVLVGECKGRGAVTQDDIDKLGTVVNALRESGLRADMLFATTRNEFTDAELALFKNYFESQQEPHPALRRPPILLTAEDMDRGPLGGRSSSDSYWNYGAFSSLVESTRVRYFDESTADAIRTAAS